MEDHATSNQPKHGIGGWSALLLFICAAFMATVELVTAFGLSHLSKIQHRIYDEYNTAITPLVHSTENKHEILLLGNSLLDEGVDKQQLQNLLPKDWELKRFVLESTSYWDWYFGLRKLYAEGARPAVICLMLSWRQLAANEVVGEFFANRLMLMKDFPEVVSRLEMHRTVASSLFAGHLSAFYAARMEIRKFILGSLIPDLPQLTILIRPPHKQPTTGHLLNEATTRLSALKAIAQTYNTQFTFIVPPALDDGQVAILTEAGQRAGVPIIIGWQRGEFTPADFSDGFHLNPIGAKRYTARAAAEIVRVLEELRQNGTPIDKYTSS